MTRAAQDLAGQKFNRLTVLSRAENRHNSARWLCQCDCGTTVTVAGTKLRSGHTKSCGCYHREIGSRAHVLDLVGQTYGRLVVLAKTKNVGTNSGWLCRCKCGTEIVASSCHLRTGHTISCGCAQRDAVRASFTKHGLRNTRIYRIWNAMVQRCTDEKASNYHNYGGRGITMDPRWLESVENFYEDMGDPPTSKHSIDRIDNDKGYTKANCRWATVQEQQNNKRSCVYLQYNGKTQTITQWARELGIPPMTITARIRQDRPIEEILSTTRLYRK